MPGNVLGRVKTGYEPRWLFAAFGCTLAVLILSHLPQDPTPETLRKGFFHIDKLEHFVAYGTITLFLLLSRRGRRSLGFFLAAFLIVAGVAAFDELTQPIFHRQAGFDDFAADVVGILLGAALSLGARRPGGGAPTGSYDACDEAPLADDTVESAVPSRRCSRRCPGRAG